MKSKRSLKAEFMIETIINGVLSIIVVATIVTFIMIQFIQGEQTTKNVALADSVAYQLDYYFQQPADVLLELKEILYNTDLVTEENIQVLVDAILKNNTRLSTILIINDEGIVEFSSPMDDSIISTDQSSYPYFVNIQEDEKIYWSNAFFSYETKYPLVGISMKVNDQVIVGILNMQEIAELIQDIDIGERNIITITDDQGTYIAHTNMDKVFLREVDSNYNAYRSSGSPIDSVLHDGLRHIPTYKIIPDRNWSISILQSYRDYYQPLLQVSLVSLFLTMVILIIAFTLSRRRIVKITNTLKDIIQGTKIISDGSYSHRIEENMYSELNELTIHFNEMTSVLEIITDDLEKQVKDRTQALSKTNLELQISLEQLKNTQDKLVESEKMAVLGQLVSGVAHEINTPIGVGLTMTSYLADATETIEKSFDQNQMSKKMFHEYLITSKNTTDVILESMSKATKLIESFKKLSTKKRASEEASFNIKTIIEDAFVTYKDTLNDNNIEYELTLSDYHIIGLPREFSQVIIALINNAITHGFIDHSSGHISVSMIISDKVTIFFSDNGIGIDESIQEKVFDHFFTTSRKNSVGLGLNIAYNIISDLFGGSIHINSDYTDGTEFIISLPKKER